MKIRTSKMGLKKMPKPERKKSEGNEAWNSLSNEYDDPEFEPTKITVRKFTSKDGEPIEWYLECKVQRYNDDVGLPYVFIQLFQRHSNPDKYSGPLKGRTVYFPLAEVSSVQGVLTGLADTADRLKLIGREDRP